MIQFYHHYNNKIRRDFFFKSSNIHPYQIPSLEKIVLSVNIDQSVVSKKKLLSYGLALELITQQKPNLTRCKKSIAAFKIRAKEPLGYKVTLRKVNLFTFLSTCINIVLARSRDWGGFYFKILNNKELKKRIKKYILSLLDVKNFFYFLN
jgi:large subunit ribosomal protein L5